ncbi:MAG TPA: PAS domain-containing protein, partial [Bacteroidia bacterium]|nr:PAS domain-containing protein [Bacteroidia bacterium]
SIISSIADTRGVIVYANKKFCEVTGYSKEELIGQDHSIINSGYHPKEFFRNMWKTIASGGVWHDEIRNRARNGTYYWVDTVILPIRDENGKTTHYLSLRMLITEQKKLEEEKKEYTHSLEEMLFLTSHKVRQPLATCLGLLNLAETKTLSGEEMLDIFRLIRVSAMQLDDFTRELTGFIFRIKERNKDA